MHAEDEMVDGLDVEEEFVSAVSSMSSPTSGCGDRRSPSAKSTGMYQYNQFRGQRTSQTSSSAFQSPACPNVDWEEDEDDDENTVKDEERRKLLHNSKDQFPYSSPSLSACASELLPLKSRLSSPPELRIEDHSTVGDPTTQLSSPSSLHLIIPTSSKIATPRRSSSGSGISVASTISSNRSSYRSALDDPIRTSMINGNIKNDQGIVDEPANDISARMSPKSDANYQSKMESSYNSFNEWYGEYSQPPMVAHPLQENVLVTLLESCLHYTFGLCVGIPVAILLIAWTCLVVPLRFIFYIITRLTLKGLWRWLWRRHHCDPLWPLGGSRDLSGQNENLGDTTLMLATTQGGTLDPAKIRHLLWRRLINLKNSSGYLSYAKLSSKMRHASDDCCGPGWCTVVWSHDTRFDMRTHVSSQSCDDTELNITSLKDLETYINRLLHDPVCGLNKKKPLWDVKSVMDFGGSTTALELRCTLLIFRLHSAITDGCICPLKFMTLVNDGQLSFDCEPRMRGDDWAQFNLFITASFHLWHAFTILAAGPTAFVMAACRRSENQVWQHSTGRRKMIDEESGGKCDRPKLKATWARVPQADQLMKLERILRCSIQELLLAFVAGALRRHFRSCAIKHPPDLYASVPVTFRDYMPIGRSFPCHFVLTPVQLPLSVDGAIPRVWETQRRLCESLDSAYPRTTRCLVRNAGPSLPKSWLRSLMASTHRASDGLVCFWRASGELSFADRQIHSLLIYPSLKRPSLFNSSKTDWMKYAFTFVQTGNEIVLSLIIDQNAFGTDPDVILRHFQYEIHGLLTHMSPRMLTLSQATFLPSPLLITRLARSPLKIVHQATVAAGIMENDDNMERIQQEHREEEEQSTVSADSETLEELEQLMATVQNELQAMKTNPRGNRGDYIVKLAELETKMESFHHSIVDKLQRREQRERKLSAVSEGAQIRYQHLTVHTPSRRPSSSSSGGGNLDDEQKSLLDVNFEPILRPLRADMDELRTQETREGVMKLRRKRSRRQDSPTRLSPRYTAAATISGGQLETNQNRQRQRYYSSPSSSDIV